MTRLCVARSTNGFDRLAAFRRDAPGGPMPDAFADSAQFVTPGPRGEDGHPERATGATCSPFPGHLLVVDHRGPNLAQAALHGVRAARARRVDGHPAHGGLKGSTFEDPDRDGVVLRNAHRTVA